MFDPYFCDADTRRRGRDRRAGAGPAGAAAALVKALAAFRGVPDSPPKRFVLDMALYVVRRDR